ncbi:MAG: protein kinase [Planctomycetota bacterium]|nr:protein kinase [Planctomycetota bacterium]
MPSAFLSYEIEGEDEAEVFIDLLQIIAVGNTPECQIIVPQVNEGSILFYLAQIQGGLEITPGHFGAKLRLNGRVVSGRTLLHNDDVLQAQGIEIGVIDVEVFGRSSGPIHEKKSPPKNEFGLSEFPSEQNDQAAFGAETEAPIPPARRLEIHRGNSRRTRRCFYCHQCLSESVENNDRDTLQSVGRIMACPSCLDDEFARHQRRFRPWGFELSARVRGDNGPGRAYQARSRAGKTVFFRALDSTFFGSRGDAEFLETAAVAYKQSLFHHPSVPGLLSCQVTGSFIIIAETWFEGISLSTLGSMHSLTYRVLVSILIGVLEVLAFAHEKGRYHGQLDRSRVLYRIENGACRIQVRGFGLNDLYNCRDIGHLRGEFLEDYSLAELPLALEEEGTDAHGDLYRLGIIAYELLSGGQPFHVVGEFSSAVQVSEAQRLKSLKHALPPELSEFVQKLLVRNIAERHQSAYEALGELRGFMGSYK